MNFTELVDNQYTHHYCLTAGEAGAEGTMPLTLVLHRAIEVATEHANILKIGYAELSEHHIAWVLSKISIEMYRYPAINESYSFTTWIEGYNRRFSVRCFAVYGADGLIGYIRSIWAAIDIDKRTIADLSLFEPASFPVVTRECPIAQVPRLPQLAPECTAGTYTFRYCDVDFNRHVNSVRYLTVILNQWNLEHYDHNSISRIDIAYHRECYYGDTVDLRTLTVGRQSDCEIVREGSRAVSFRIQWDPTESISRL